MEFKDVWKPRVDGIDDADSSAVNEIAEAVIEMDEHKQDSLTNEQLQNIEDVPNKADKEYVDTKTNNIVGSQFVPLTKDTTGIVVYENQYANASGVLTGGSAYTSYEITANDDFSCWFEECASVYTSLAIYTGEVSRETFVNRYRRFNTEDTLPTKDIPLTVKQGNSIVVTVYKGYGFELYNDSEFFSVKLLNNDILLNADHIKQVKTELIKESKVRYEQKGDNHTEELAIYIPCTVGYLQYNFAHYVNESKNADNWHLWKVYAVDDSLSMRYEVVTSGEWEMALKLKDRSDFSGGYMHGDEIGTEITVLVDGKTVNPTSLTELTTFKSLRLVTKSNVYDPINNTTLIAIHGCERIFENGELTIKQNVIWQVNGELGSNYLAMFPIAKTVGDIQIINKMYTDMDYSQFDLTQLSTNLYINEVKKVTAYGENTGVIASVEALEYPKGLTGGDRFLVSDNGGQNYYKMYFVAQQDGSVASGDVWKSKVVYKIDVGE